MSRDTNCATCHELVFLKLYLEIILNRFGNVAGTPQVPT